MKKQAIILAGFGTSHRGVLAGAWEDLYQQTQKAFPDSDIYQAYTSRVVGRALRTGSSADIYDERSILRLVQARGYEEVYIQPLHIVPGLEYGKVRNAVMSAAHTEPRAFRRIRLGRPLLYYAGQEGAPDDYSILLEALEGAPGTAASGPAKLWMGHGGLHPGNSAYALLHYKMQAGGYSKSFLFTIEGFPDLDQAVAEMKNAGIREVELAPLLLLCGEHAQVDMAGSGPDSAMTALTQQGFDVRIELQGLLERPVIQKIFLQHIREMLAWPEAHKDRRRAFAHLRPKE